MRRLLEITTGRHPFQVAVVAACPLAAAAVLISGEHPASLDLALTPQYADAWLVLMLAGGITAQTGAFWPGDLDTGLIVEAGGLCLLAAMLSIYVVALFLVQGGQAVAAGGLLGGISAACWWRVGQIVGDVRKVWRAQAEGLTAHVRTLADPDSGPAGGRPGAR